MIDLLKKIFGKKAEDGKNHTRASEHDIQVATGALLLEMAHMDGEFSDAEQESILSILRRDHGLDAQTAAALLEASREARKNNVDLWPLTNLINQNYSREEKRRVIETVWKVAYADGKLDMHEDYLMHKLANLLRLTHKELIDAKLKVLHSSTGKESN
ncbi:MAG: TerB family tellurite resistance protein [Deltaproteobacteria bacterium]|nr:TerB family tellurite resistance protein [Deltaproteobacteria bacterium]